MGLSTLAVAVGEEAETVEVVVEPFLVRRGLLARTPRGRVATPAAWEQLGLRPAGPVAATCGDARGDPVRLISAAVGGPFGGAAANCTGGRRLVTITSRTP